MSPDQLLEAHRALWREAFSPRYSLLRVVRSLGRLRFGAFLMCLVMNGFYCLKRLRGNEPIAFNSPVTYSETGWPTGAAIGRVLKDERHPSV